MSGFFKIVLTLVFAAVLFWMILVNREAVGLSFEPFLNSFPVPLAIVIFAAVIFGFVWGAMVVWLNEGKTRAECRKQRKEIQRLGQQTGVSL